MAGETHVRAWRECTGLKVVDLRTRVATAVVSGVRPADDQNPPIGQQCGSVLVARNGHVARRLELTRSRIENLRRPQDFSSGPVSPDHEHTVILQRDRHVGASGRLHRAYRREGGGGGIEDLRRGQRSACPHLAAYHQHAPPRERRCDGADARNAHISRERPTACCRVVDLGAGSRVPARPTTGHQDPAIGKDDRSMARSRCRHRGGSLEGPCDWIVEFGRGVDGIAAASGAATGDQDLARLKKCGLMSRSLHRHRTNPNHLR